MTEVEKLMDRKPTIHDDTITTPGRKIFLSEIHSLFPKLLTHNITVVFKTDYLRLRQVKNLFYLFFNQFGS